MKASTHPLYRRGFAAGALASCCWILGFVLFGLIVRGLLAP